MPLSYIPSQAEFQWKDTEWFSVAAPQIVCKTWASNFHYLCLSFLLSKTKGLEHVKA